MTPDAVVADDAAASFDCDDRAGIPLDDPVILKAYRLALDAHAGQVDKAGEEYANHPLAVARSMSRAPRNRRTLMTVALLHDVVEDPSVTIDEVREGFGDDVANAVALLTHERGVPYLEYVQSVADSGNDVAIRVKIADLTQNMNLSRLPVVTETDKRRVTERYVPALATLVSALRTQGDAPKTT